MYTAWIGIFGAALLCTAACASANTDEQAQPSTSANTQGVDGDTIASADSSDSDSDSDSDDQLDFGWTTKIPATATNGFAEAFSLQDIVTNPTVKVRRDNMACVTCHSWATFADRQSFCDRVDAFEAEPTAKYDGTDSPSAKPHYLKSILSRWKAAGCPN